MCPSNVIMGPHILASKSVVMGSSISSKSVDMIQNICVSLGDLLTILIGPRDSPLV